MTAQRFQRRPRPTAGRSGAISGNPILVGAVTLLVAIVGVYLSYNANNGLPFIPTRQLRLQLTNGANLNRDQEVREGGFRVGVVAGLAPTRLTNGRAGAEVALKLDKSAGPIPIDSTFAVRARGVAGSKFIEITRGQSPQVFADNAKVPVGATTLGLELDQALSGFDQPTRAGVQRSLYGLGNGLASRGGDLNSAVGQLPRLLTLTAPVMANLADPSTDLKGLVRSLSRTLSILAPVAPQQAHVFAGMADTFAALSRDSRALDATLAQSPQTLSSATASLRAERPVLGHTAALMRSLEPVAARLRTALPPINAALTDAPGPLRRSTSLSTRLADTLRALRNLSSDAATGTALRAATATVATVQPQLRFYGPWITVCQIPQLWLEFVPDVLTVPTSTGYAQRGLVDTTSPQHNDPSVMGANEFATGRGVLPGGVPVNLHANFFPPAVDSRGNADCAAGQSGYAYGANPFDTTPDHFYSRAVVVNPRADRYGPLWGKYDNHGRPLALGPTHVPAGETFTVTPGGRGASELP